MNFILDCSLHFSIYSSAGLNNWEFLFLLLLFSFFLLTMSCWKESGGVVKPRCWARNLTSGGWKLQVNEKLVKKGKKVGDYTFWTFCFIIFSLLVTQLINFCWLLPVNCANFYWINEPSIMKYSYGLYNISYLKEFLY